MSDNLHQAYLDALGISVWSLRESSGPDKSVGLKLGPGKGSILLVCAADIDSASKLANDLGRALGSIPVWSWPTDSANSVSLADAANDQLFTTIAIFGSALAKQFFGEKFPATLSSASLVVLPAMEDLKTRADARRLLWDVMCQAGMVAVT